MKIALLLFFSLLINFQFSERIFAQNFTGTELLGCPTDHSVTVNLVADAALTAYFKYGTVTGTYTSQTTQFNAASNQPIEAVMDGLAANTRYYYRMVYIGGMCSDQDEALVFGQEQIDYRIATRTGITPYGILPSAQYSSVRKNILSKEFWSRLKELLELQLCAFYKSGQCTIRKYREHMCATHFCSSIGGASGTAFWGKVNEYLIMAETALSQYTMQQLGWPPVKIKKNSVTTSDLCLENENGIFVEENYEKLWCKWFGREKEFYIKCYETVKKPDALTFNRITGIQREILERTIIETQKKFKQNVLPDYMILHPEVVIENAGVGKTRLVLDKTSIEVPSVAFTLVKGFNGNRTTVEVFHFGYDVLFNMNDIVEELRNKVMLI